jgi:hypothetical protein
MAGVFEQLEFWADLDDSAKVHDGNPVADVGNNGEVVGNEDKTQAVFLLKSLEKVDDLTLD